ncbi:MAG: carbohydrate ABC transporter permease [Campylobacteraceae bacterium]|nr:carbohydrate ABC transporter permease [Campylobacteraceae bacterium]
MKKKKIIRTIICWLVLLPVMLTVLFPFVVTVLTALKPRNELTQIPPNFLPSEFQWGNFIEVWQNTNIASSLLNSLFISTVATIIALVVAAPCAYAMTRFDFKGKTAYRFFLLVTQMLSPIVLVLGLFRLMVYMGVVDSLGFLSVIYAAFNIAFCVWMLQSYFETIPKDLEESAWIDGASRFRSLLTIFLPLALPAVVIVAMFTFVNSWNEFIIAFSTLRDSSSYTIQLGIIEMTGYYSVRWDYIMVSVIIATIPVAILFAWLQKHLVGGLTSGSVK